MKFPCVVYECEVPPDGKRTSIPTQWRLVAVSEEELKAEASTSTRDAMGNIIWGPCTLTSVPSGVLLGAILYGRRE